MHHHSVVLAEQMLVQEHDQCHSGTHGVAGSVCQDLRYIEHLHAADQGCDHNIDQDWTKEWKSDLSENL